MNIAASCAELAQSESALTNQMETTPERTRASATFLRNWGRESTDTLSKRCANKIPAAGISGRIDRAFIVQFTNAVKMKVPDTHRPKSSDSGSRHFRSANPAIDKIANPAAIARLS